MSLVERRSRGARASLPTPDEQRILDEWQPEPLVPEIDEPQRHEHLLNAPVVSSKPGKHITVDGLECLNFATHNYLGLADHARLEAASIATVRKYGVGSCGPRAFYGTMDVHLRLEEELAAFLGVQEAVLYSFGFSTIASAIPAYAKQGDVIFVDQCCNFAIKQGCIAARSRLIQFRHNDVEHLEQLAEQLAQEQIKLYKKPIKLRTFLIVEGIYAKTGQLCPLPDIIRIKHKYKMRLFIDESRSFGCLGAEGKGVTQHFDNVDFERDIDLVMASLENAPCAYGGFCAGTSFVVDHQRLSGVGYCFSASLPPFQAQVAREALNIIKDEPHIVRDAQTLYTYAHDKLATQLTKLTNISHPLSPIKLLAHVDDPSLKHLNDHEKVKYARDIHDRLQTICENILRQEKLALSVSRYLEDEEMTSPIASIRLVVSGCMSKADIDKVVEAIERHSS